MVTISDSGAGPKRSAPACVVNYLTNLLSKSQICIELLGCSTWHCIPLSDYMGSFFNFCLCLPVCMFLILY